jgi:hypothetical protein
VGAGATYVDTFNPNVAKTIQDAIDGVFNFGGNLVNNLTTTADQAIAAESAAASNAISFSNSGLSTVAALASTALGTSSNAASNSNSLASEALNNSQLGQTSILTNPAILIAGVVAIGLIAYFASKRR